jgi:hypothetical protein
MYREKMMASRKRRTFVFIMFRKTVKRKQRFSPIGPKNRMTTSNT